MNRDTKSAVVITDAYVKSIPPPQTGQETHYDALVPSFGLRVSAGGAKTWMLQRRVNGVPKRIKIGRYPAISIAAAREEARKLSGMIEVGKDPQAEAAREREYQRRQDQAATQVAAQTFESIRKRFMAEYVESLKGDGKTPRLRARTREMYRLTFNRSWFKDWDSRPIGEITRRDFLALLATVQKKHGGYTANRLLSCVRKLFNWALSQDIINTSPAAGVSRPVDEVARERVLNDRELYYLWQAFSVVPLFARPLKALLVTAQRREEVTGISSPELENVQGDAPLWRIPKQRAKNNCEHLVPLSQFAVEVIGPIPTKPGLLFTTTGKTPISGFSKAKENINARLMELRASTSDPSIDSLLADWRIHDFRRTAATRMAELGTSRDVVELILNHQSGVRAGVAGVYNRSELIDDRRLALEIWARYLQRVTSQPMSEGDSTTLRAELRSEHRRRLMGDWPKPHLVKQAA